LAGRHHTKDTTSTTLSRLEAKMNELQISDLAAARAQSVNQRRRNRETDWVAIIGPAANSVTALPAALSVPQESIYIWTSSFLTQCARRRN
jgi:hypothetical protein